MSTPAPVKPRRVRFVISLRALMLLILIVGIWLGLTINRAESQRKAVAALKENGAIVLYDYESMGRAKAPTARQWRLAWAARRSLGDDYFQSVTYANLTPAVGHRYELADRDLAPLEALDHLEELNITDTPITDAGLAYLERLTNMRSLVLDNISQGGPHLQLTDAGLAHLRGMTKLENLDLVGIDVSDAGLEHLRRMTNLQSLGLSQTKVSGTGLAHLRAMGHLRSLRLDRTPLTDPGLANVCELTSLQVLRLAGTRTTDAGLANLAGMTLLRRLDLGPENSSDAGTAVHLAVLISSRSCLLKRRKSPTPDWSTSRA